MTTREPSDFLSELRALDACTEAVEWAKTKRDMREAWQTCERGDWMLWLVGTLSGKPGSASRRRLVLAAVDCARIVEHLDTTGAAVACNDMTEGHGLAVRGITVGMVRSAADAADAAAADAAYVADAADAAAADAAADAAAFAAYVAYADNAAVASGAASASARSHTLRECADIVRRHYPRTPSLRRKP